MVTISRTVEKNQVKKSETPFSSTSWKGGVLMKPHVSAAFPASATQKNSSWQNQTHSQMQE